MTPAQTFEVLEKVENMIDSLHSQLQTVRKHLREAVEARMNQLVAMADSLRAKTILQQGGSGG